MDQLQVERINTKQMAVLLIFFTIGDMLLFLPSNMASISHQDAWISALIGLVVGVVMAWFIYEFSQCFKGQNLVQIYRQVLGKWLGTAVSLLYLLAMFNNGVTQIREIGDLVTTQMMTETPMRAICLLMVIVLVVAIRSGLESIARTAEAFLLVFIIMFAATIILLIPDAKWSKLTPVLEAGTPELIQSALYFASFPFCELFVMWMILPQVTPNKHERRDFILATTTAGLAIFSIVIISLLVLGSYLTEHQMYSTYTLAKKISVGHFLERVEAIFAVTWLLSTYFRMVIYVYAFIKGVAELLQLKDYRRLTIPLGLLAYGYALILAPNVIFFNSTNSYWVTWDLTYVTVIPTIVYLIHRWKLLRKKRTTKYST